MIHALPKLECDSYLARIGYAGNLNPTLDTLRALHFAHASAIPFENLDILLGRTISLDLADVHAKLVTARRGGYCFEHNAALCRGPRVAGLQGGPARGAGSVRHNRDPPTDAHAPGSARREWALAGRRRLRLRGATVSGQHAAKEPETQGGWSFRIHNEEDVFVLQSMENGGWLDLYAFTREPQHPVDYITGNHYTSTHPHSPFVQNLIVQKGGLHIARHLA